MRKERGIKLPDQGSLDVACDADLNGWWSQEAPESFTPRERITIEEAVIGGATEELDLTDHNPPILYPLISYN